MIVFKYILLIFIFIYIIIINNYLNEKFVITYGKYMPRYYIKNYYDFQKRRFKEINDDGGITDHPCIGSGADKVNSKINKITLLSLYKIGKTQYIEKPTADRIFPPTTHDATKLKILTLATSDSDNDIFEKYIYIVTLREGDFTLERSNNKVLENIYDNTFKDAISNNTSYEYTKTISQLGNDDNNRLLYYMFTDYNFEEIKKYFVCKCRPPSLKPLCDRKEDPSCDEVSEIIISFVLNFNLNNLL
jgi:hypothetical protein